MNAHFVSYISILLNIICLTKKQLRLVKQEECISTSTMAQNHSSFLRSLIQSKEKKATAAAAKQADTGKKRAGASEAAGAGGAAKKRARTTSAAAPGWGEDTDSSQHSDSSPYKHAQTQPAAAVPAGAAAAIPVPRSGVRSSDSREHAILSTPMGPNHVAPGGGGSGSGTQSWRSPEGMSFSQKQQRQVEVMIPLSKYPTK